MVSICKKNVVVVVVVVFLSFVSSSYTREKSGIISADALILSDTVSVGFTFGYQWSLSDVMSEYFYNNPDNIFGNIQIMPFLNISETALKLYEFNVGLGFGYSVGIFEDDGEVGLYMPVSGGYAIMNTIYGLDKEFVGSIGAKLRIEYGRLGVSAGYGITIGQYINMRGISASVMLSY